MTVVGFVYAQATEASSVLIQYGALGVTLIACGYAVRILYQRLTQQHEWERQRADRMEAEVQRLNNFIQEKVVPVLSESTKVISDALNQIRESRRDGDRS